MLTLLDKLAPTEKPEMKLLLIATEIILLNASMTMTNRNGDKGSPYGGGGGWGGGGEGVPLINTEK
jgi:hypothetical protein